MAQRRNPLYNRVFPTWLAGHNSGGTAPRLSTPARCSSLPRLLSPSARQPPRPHLHDLRFQAILRLTCYVLLLCVRAGFGIARGFVYITPYQTSSSAEKWIVRRQLLFDMELSGIRKVSGAVMSFPSHNYLRPDQREVHGAHRGVRSGRSVWGGNPQAYSETVEKCEQWTV